MASKDWNVGDTSGMVDIGTHSLFFRAAGPTRDSPGTPAVIIIPGIGDACVTWSATIRHISAFARVYAYDRSGLGSSELPENFAPEDKSYRNIARELQLLLQTARVQPPYLLVMHSMGGLPGREFLHLYSETVAGMVFLDAVTENNYKTRPKELPQIMRAMSMGVDLSYLWKGEFRPKMTEEELQQALASEGLVDGVDVPQATTEQREKATMAEVQNLIPSSDVLAEKNQRALIPLGKKPLSVVKGNQPGEWRNNFEAAKAAGKGTEEERKLVSDFLATADATQLLLQYKLLQLSQNSRLVDARYSWHNVHWYQPELVAAEVRWCLFEYSALKLSVAMAPPDLDAIVQRDMDDKR